MSLPRLRRVWRQRLFALFRRHDLDAELSRELAFHHEQLVAENVAAGLTAQEARHAARRALGNVPLLEEQCRDQRRVTWLHDLRQDVVYGLRLLRKSPGFTCIAVASLALGIGANTAIWGAMDVVLRDRLPIPNDDRVVVVRTFPQEDPRQEAHAAVADYFAWKDENRSFDLMGVALGNQADFGAEEEIAPSERILGEAVTAELFSTLGVQPVLGRVFTDADDQIAEPARVIVISDRLWRRRFGARPDILAKQVQLDGVTSTIIGVMAPNFHYPNNTVEYWVPLHLSRSQANGPERFFIVTARLKDGVTVAQAQSDLERVAAELAREDPDRHRGWSVRVKPLRDAMFGWTKERLLTLGGAVALVLLVAGANVAGLLLARGSVRMPEIAVRAALGAGRGRIVRQLLTESVVLSLIGGVLGVLVAFGGTRALVAMTPPPGGVRMSDIGLNTRMLGATAVIAILTSLVFGLAPALAASRASLTGSLKEDTGTTSRHRLRGALVAAQIAVTCVLLIGSGLLMKGFERMATRDLHFDPEKLLTFELHIPTSEYLHRMGSIGGLPYFDISPPPSLAMQRVYDSLRRLQGAESVAGISYPPLNSLTLPSIAVTIEGQGEPSRVVSNQPAPILAIGVGSTPEYIGNRHPFSAVYFLVTPHFFSTMRAPLVRGRDFDERDTSVAQWVAIVNESTARRFWPGEDPIGKRFTLETGPEERPREVIGVVRDIPLTLRQTDARPVIYASYLQQPARFRSPGANMFGRMTFILRSAGDPMTLVPGARRAVAEIDPDRPLSNVATMDQVLGAGVTERRYYALVLIVFALTTTLLAAIGIYGVMAYSVAQRTHEIGIRMALGAGVGEVIDLVGRRAVFVISIGLALGLAGSLALARLIASQLWQVTPTDPATFATVILLLLLVALLACVLPARRAIAVDPATALRSE